MVKNKKKPKKVSRNIPEAIKRQVREKCNFGCIICGHLFYEYDHKIPLSIVNCHDVENIILLCPNHHAEKTRGLLPKEKIDKYTKNPIAFENPELLKANLSFGAVMPSVTLATNVFYSSNPELFVPIALQDTSPFIINRESNNILLSFVSYDESGKEVIKIIKNELQVFPDAGDIKIIGTQITIRSALNKILLKLSFDHENNNINLMKCIFSNKFSKIELTGEKLHITNNNFNFSGCTFDGAEIGIAYNCKKLIGIHQINN